LSAFSIVSGIPFVSSARALSTKPPIILPYDPYFLAYAFSKIAGQISNLLGELANANSSLPSSNGILSSTIMISSLPSLKNVTQKAPQANHSSSVST
jgi:hypothetical protein